MGKIVSKENKMQDNYAETTIMVVKYHFLVFRKVLFAETFTSENNRILYGSNIANGFVKKIEQETSLFPLTNIVIKIHLVYRPWPVGFDQEKFITIDLRKSKVENGMAILDLIHKTIDAAVESINASATISIK